MTPALPNPWLLPVTEKPQDKIARAETPASEAIVPTFTLQYLLRRPDLPPLKWSSLKYVFRMEDKIDGKEEAYG